MNIVAEFFFSLLHLLQPSHFHKEEQNSFSFVSYTPSVHNYSGPLMLQKGTKWFPKNAKYVIMKFLN